MANLFRKHGKKTWWVNYRVDGKRVRHSLGTTDERVARKKLRKIELDLLAGELQPKSVTPLKPFLEAFCTYLGTVRSSKAYKNDLSYLRAFFGPVCDALALKSTHNHRRQPTKPVKVRDRLAHRHVHVATLEDLTPREIEQFLTTRIAKDGIAPKTANRQREVLHVMFNYAIRQHGYRSPDRRFPNPVDAIPPRKQDEHQIRFLTLMDIDKQLQVLAGKPVLQTMVAVLIYAGRRYAAIRPDQRRIVAMTSALRRRPYSTPRRSSRRRAPGWRGRRPPARSKWRSGVGADSPRTANSSHRAVAGRLGRAARDAPVGPAAFNRVRQQRGPRHVPRTAGQRRHLRRPSLYARQRYRRRFRQRRPGRGPNSRR